MGGSSTQMVCHSCLHLRLGTTLNGCRTCDASWLGKFLAVSGTFFWMLSFSLSQSMHRSAVSSAHALVDVREQRTCSGQTLASIRYSWPAQRAIWRLMALAHYECRQCYVHYLSVVSIIARWQENSHSMIYLHPILWTRYSIGLKQFLLCAAR